MDRRRTATLTIKQIFHSRKNEDDCKGKIEQKFIIPNFTQNYSLVRVYRVINIPVEFPPVAADSVNGEVAINLYP